MKKFGRFVFGTLSVATLAAGAYYVYKNFIKNDSSDDFDEFEDDFDDFDTEEDFEEISDTREYVSIQMESNPADETTENDEDSVTE